MTAGSSFCNIRPRLTKIPPSGLTISPGTGVND